MAARRKRGGAAATVLATAALGAATATAAWLADRREKIDKVDPELRGAFLYAPHTAPGAAVPVLRRFVGAHATSVPLAVRRSTRLLPAPGGRPAVPVTLYERRRATDAVRPAVLYLHGGGFLVGAPAGYHSWCSRVADVLDALVVNVDYRLAPEDPFPAGLDDAYTALQWLHAHAAELRIDPDRLAVAGDSAGGGLAACLAQRAHDDQVPVAFQLLIYPMLDDRTCLRPVAGDRGTFVWTPANNRLGWTSYLGREPSESFTPPPYAVAARRVDLAGLPPAWIGVGELDLFQPEDVRYAERLRAAGVPVELLELPGMYHGADAILPGADVSQEFRTASVEALRGALTRASD